VEAGAGSAALKPDTRQVSTAEGADDATIPAWLAASGGCPRKRATSVSLICRVMFWPLAVTRRTFFAPGPVFTAADCVQLTGGVATMRPAALRATVNMPLGEITA